MGRQFNCIISENAGSEIYDFQIPLLSLPYLFYKSDKCIPKITNFFKPSIKKIDEWNNNLSLSKEKINIGISISGNPKHAKDNRRRIRIKNF